MKNTYNIEGLRQVPALFIIITTPLSFITVSMVLSIDHPALTPITGTGIVALFMVLGAFFGRYLAKKFTKLVYEVQVLDNVYDIKKLNCYNRRIVNHWSFSLDSVKNYKIERYNGTILKISLKDQNDLRILNNSTFNDDAEMERFIEYFEKQMSLSYPNDESIKGKSFMETKPAWILGICMIGIFISFIAAWLVGSISISQPIPVMMSVSIIILFWVNLLKNRGH